MKDKEKIQTLKNCFEEIIWMAARYANGRSTFAPSIVRGAIKDFQKVFPDWNPKPDGVIKKPTEDMIKGAAFEDDYLWDLFECKEK